MFWLRQHILPLIDGFSQEREKSPGAESFRSALSDGAESFYSAFSGHRSSVYYDAESSDLDSSDSDSRYADVDEELLLEQAPEIGTEFKEAVTKESAADDAYESFSYGKLFEDVYGSVVHRPPLLKRQQTHQTSQNEKQALSRKWRPAPRIPLKANLFQDHVPPVVNRALPADCSSLPLEFSCHVEHEDDWQETKAGELGDEIQKKEVTAPPFSCLEQAAEEFAVFILDEAQEDVCRFINDVSTLGGNGGMPGLSLKGLSNNSGDQAELMEHAVAVAKETTQHTMTPQDQDILDAFNRQFEPCFDSEEELDPQAFENASEDEIDNTGQSDIEEKGLLNRNALLGTFKKFPKSTLKSLPHVHSFSGCSGNGGDGGRCRSPFFPVTSSASDLTEKYLRRHSSDTADFGVQPKGLESKNFSFLSSDPDISTNLSSGHTDGTMVDALNIAMGSSFPVQLEKGKVTSVKAIDTAVQAHCLPVTRPEKLLEESQSEFPPALFSPLLLHENKGNRFSRKQEKCDTLLSEPPIPPPRSPRHSNVMQPSQCKQISKTSTSKVHCSHEIGQAQVENQVTSESGPCLESHLKVPARRKKTMQGFQSFKGISVEDSASSEKVSVSAACPLLLKESLTVVEDSSKEELFVQDNLPVFQQEFLHRETCDESEQNSSFASLEDLETNAETRSSGILRLLSSEDPEPDEEPDEEPPNGRILRLPFSLSQLTGHLFEDDSPLDVVSFHVVDNCDFLKGTCGDSSPYMVKLGHSDDFSAFLVDPDTSEHSELGDSDTDSVFEDAASQSFNESNLDSVQSGFVTPDENSRKHYEDFEDQQPGKQLHQLKPVSYIPSHPKRKCTQESLEEKQCSTIGTRQCMDLKKQDKINVDLAPPETSDSWKMASMATSIPDEPQGAHMSCIQCQEGILICKHAGAETFQECNTLEADVHRKEAILEMSGTKEATGALSGTAPRPTSSSYQEAHRAGVVCDKPGLEKTSEGSLVGAALVDADNLDGSRSQSCVMKDHDMETSPDDSLQVIKNADCADLKELTKKHYNGFGEDGQRHGGSPRSEPQTLNDQTETRFTRGLTFTEKDSRSNSLSPDTKDLLVPPMGTTEAEVAEMCKSNGGIQGHHNSCYLDATLFAMFSCTYIFDDILIRSRDPDDIKEYDEIQKVLRDDIVCTLRKEKYVPHENVMKLRELLDSLGGVSGLTTEEKDPEEFLNSLIHALRVPPFLKLSSQQETHLYQLFVAKDDLLEIPTVQQLFHQSIHESKIKLKEIPKALIIQMPRCGKQFKLYDHILPSLELDITDALENSPRFCYVCGRQATHECWDCFRPDMGLEVTSYCDSCNGTVHKHQDRKKHTQAKLDNNFGDTPPRRHIMRLFAVVCIETSHYVCFVKCPVKEKKHTWCFFDSMADREGGEDGHNIPKVEEYVDAENWLSPGGLDKFRGLSAQSKSRHLPGKTRRLFCDAYMCMYEDPLVMQYK